MPRSLCGLARPDVPALVKIPFARSTPIHLAAWSVLAEDNNLSRQTHHTLAFIERILRHRFRFDIEVSEVLRIKMGEYAIEIE